jgi:hypothetical protein
MATQELSFDDLWDRYMGAYVTPTEYAAEGWHMGRILRDLRELWGNHPTDRLTPDELAEVANGIAAGLEERGYPMTPATDFDTVTLTTAHAASSYGRPVLVIDGEAYGPEDALPDGTSAGDVLLDFMRRFLAPVGLGLELTDRRKG